MALARGESIPFWVIVSLSSPHDRALLFRVSRKVVQVRAATRAAARRYSIQKRGRDKRSELQRGQRLGRFVRARASKP